MPARNKDGGGRLTQLLRNILAFLSVFASKVESRVICSFVAVSSKSTK